jgi:1-deoxy-D-xylulose-5-phosphate synthase
MAPKDEDEFRQMLFTAIYSNHPTAIRYPRGSAIGVPLTEHLLPLTIGKSELLQEGADIVLIALGTMVHPTLEAARKLEADGISCTVINARFAKPLDKEMITAWARKTGRIVAIEEGCLPGGFGSAVAECLADACIRAAILRCGISDHLVQHGPTDRLLQMEGLCAEEIAARVLKFFRATPAPVSVQQDN